MDFRYNCTATTNAILINHAVMRGSLCENWGTIILKIGTQP